MGRSTLAAVWGVCTPVVRYRGRSLRCRSFGFAVVAVFLVIVAGRGFAAPHDLVSGFATQLSGVAPAAGSRVVADGAGGIYVTGFFEGTADVGPGPGALQLVGAGNSDAFLCKLDASGSVIWAFRVGGARDDAGSHLAVGPGGELYWSGEFSGTVDFDPGPGVVELTSVASSSAFLCMLDSAGNLLRAQVQGDGACWGMALDGSGNLYCASGPNLYKLDNAGGAVWTLNVGYGYDLAVDPSGNSYVTGTLTRATDFDPGAGEMILTPSNSRGDAFVYKLNTDGIFQWVKSTTGGVSTVGRSVVVDGAGEVYVGGNFRRATDFEPGPEIFELSGTEDCAFVWNFGPDGSFGWARALRGSLGSVCFGVSLGPDGTLHSTGAFLGILDAAPGSDIVNFTSRGASDIFAVKLDVNGWLLWAGTMGGVGNDVANHGFASLSGDYYVAGQFNGTADFDPGAGVLNLVSAASQGAFFAELEAQSLPVGNADWGHVLADRLLTSLDDPRTESVLTNDRDLNARAVLSVSSHDPTSVLGALVLVNGDGTFVYDPTGVASLQSLAPGESATDSFTYSVSDGVDTAVSTVTIRVYGAGTQLPALGHLGMGILFAVLMFAGAGMTLRSRLG